MANDDSIREEMLQACNLRHNPGNRLSISSRKKVRRRKVQTLSQLFLSSNQAIMDQIPTEERLKMPPQDSIADNAQEFTSVMEKSADQVSHCLTYPRS